MKNKNTVIIIAVLLISVAFFLGSKTGLLLNNKQESPLVLSQANPSPPTTLVGKQAPDFTLTAIDGQNYRLRDLQGKVVIVFGMAGWCGECLPEGQALSKIQSTYQDKVQPIGVAFTKGDNKALLEGYRKTGKVTIPLAVDTDNVGQKYNLIQLDTTYIINKQGIVVYKSEQSMNYQELQQQLQKIL